jgi:phage tail-like protein
MPSEDPGISLRYELTIEACKLGTFTSVEGLEAEYEVLEYPEGGNNGFVHRLPGRLKYGMVKLSRAIDKDSGQLAAWFSSFSDKVTPTTASISVQDGNKKEIARWNLVGAWPVKYHGPSLDSSKEAVAIETMELAHDGFTFAG